ncbi:MAG TPA: penicillin-binding transpeptidase domain-containing protein [Myxococcota bacterium]
MPRRSPSAAFPRPPVVALIPLALGLCGAVAMNRASAHEPAAAPAVDPDEDEVAPAPVAPQHSDLVTVVVGDAVLVKRALTAPNGLDLRSARVEGGHLTAALGTATAVLTQEPALDDKLKRYLDDDARAPYAATVLLEPSTGRVLAIAESSTRGDPHGIAFQPIARAASVFKVVTTSALLEAGVSPNQTVCIHGGKTRMQPSLLVDTGKDSTCIALGDALAHSKNVAIAKLALAHLEPDGLRAMARRWGFDAPLPIDAPVALTASPTSIPDDPFGFANAAAGFGDVKLSALHGAVLAAIVANGGMMVPPPLVDDVKGGELPPPKAPHRVVDARVAQELAAMMKETVASGTAHKAFSASPRLNVSAAGKTGSLADYATGLETTWFVGYAPADHPEVAVATVVVNTNKWNVRAPAAAKEALRAYFQLHPANSGAAVARR